jgi:hypothetical protein
MTSPAAQLIKEKLDEIEQQSSNNYSSVTVRLSPKYGLMIKALSKALGFPISTTLTEITSKNIFNYLSSLDDESFEEFKSILYKNENTLSTKEFIKSKRLEEPSFDFEFIKD